MIDEKIRTRARQSFGVYRRVLAVKWPMSFIGAIKGSLIRNETLKENLMIIPHQDNRENNSKPVQRAFHSKSNVILLPKSNCKTSTFPLPISTDFVRLIIFNSSLNFLHFQHFFHKVSQPPRTIHGCVYGWKNTVKEIAKKKRKEKIIDTFQAKKPFVSSGPCHERNQ